MPANILLVEDEPAIQELIAANLARAGHHVVRANDAESAQRIGAVADAVVIGSRIIEEIENNPGEEVASCRIPELAHALWKPGFDPLYEVMMSL